jgi:NAD-dependent DNA ligase
MNIDGLGPQIVELLLQSGKIKDIADLYSLRIEDVENLERMGKKSAENLVNAIEESKSRGLERLLFALGIRQVGEVAAEEIAGRMRTLDKIMSADFVYSNKKRGSPLEPEDSPSISLYKHFSVLISFERRLKSRL